MSRLLAAAVLVAVAALASIQAVACGAVESNTGTQSTVSGQIAVTTGTSLPAITGSTGGAASTQDTDGTDLYPAPVEGKWGYIDTTGAWVIEPRFGYADHFSQGLARARPYNDWRHGYIDVAGEFVIQPQFYTTAGFGRDSVAAVVRDDAGVFTEGYIDKTGKDLTEEPFDETWSFSEGLGLVRRDEAWGYIDVTGRIIIPLEFYSAEPFSEGLAAVRRRMGEPHGYIDTTGAWVIEPQFDIAYAFYRDLAMVCLDRETDSWAYIDKTGAVVWESGPGAFESHETSAASAPTSLWSPTPTSSHGPNDPGSPVTTTPDGGTATRPPGT